MRRNINLACLFFHLLAITAFWLLPSPKLWAQPGLDTIKLSQIKLSENLTAKTGLFIDTANQVEEEHLHSLPALRPIPLSLTRKLDPKYVSKDCFLQFTVENDTDSAITTFFLPGFYFNNINLFKFNPDKERFELISGTVSNRNVHSNVVKKLELKAGETATYITELEFIKTTTNTLKPTLARDFYLETLLEQLQNERRLNSIITYLICGLLLMMIFYSLAAFYANRNLDFLYYTGYASLLGVMFFLKAFLYHRPTLANFFFESYFDFILQCTGTLFYFMFLRKFTKAARDFPLLNKVLFIGQLVTIIAMIIFTYFNFFSDNFQSQNMVENNTKYLWSASTVFFIAYALVKRSPTLRFLAIGHSFLFLGGLLSLYLINSTQRFRPDLTSLINDSLFWYEMGIVFELIFFLVALSIKNKTDITESVRERERLILEKEKTAMETKMEILAAKQDERNRISADMHDELGSGVTAIRLMSELAKTKLKENTVPEIEKISNSANELITKMNTIIWTMKSSNDSVDNLIAYTRSYALEFLDNTDIKCDFEYPESIPTIELSGEKRRNIFLCIKESLNNIVKHSGATHVTISFRIRQDMEISIHDNGVGLNMNTIREFSNGLSNMRKRMEDINGSFSIRNYQGTVVTLTVPLT